MTDIRPYAAGDLESLYTISLATGLAGGDASHLHADPKLIGHIYSAPYACLEPALALVVEDDAGVAGYAVGAVDTEAWEARLERNWWPALRSQYADPVETDPKSRTADQRRAFIIHHPGRTPHAVVKSHPAHVHMNLLPRQQRRGVGTALLEAWLELASVRGAPGVHVGVNHANDRALSFWSARSFAPLKLDAAEASRTIWMGRCLAAPD
jgi:GNAT superfamily N-acetyltransferase